MCIKTLLILHFFIYFKTKYISGHLYGLAAGLCRLLTTVKDGERFSAAKDFLRPIMARQNLHVATHSQAIKVGAHGPCKR